MPRAEDDAADDLNHDPSEPVSPPPPVADKAPLLDYPSPPTTDDDDGFGETESWPEIGRAMLIVFSVLGIMFFVTFGLCGVLFRGCG